MKLKYEEVFGVNVKYIPGSADFFQVVKVKNDKVKTSLSGIVELLACKNGRCMPLKNNSLYS